MENNWLILANLSAVMNIKQLQKSFSYASAGIIRVWREEQNFRIQLFVAVLIICAMFVFDLSGVERAILTLAIAMVLVLELMNSIVERVVDLLKPRVHLHVKEVKDVMAGTVLVAAVAAVLVGVLIMWPYLLNWLFG
ncbi:diacylglycerol kinase [Patescibacteria group bacterium]|nr:diacylglycerol kinase [Patescibacteria group bacterium]MBU1028698.1 diacylglycerol kinase [Patescibacteria group bacterium]MBU1915963.1 diacylglycerol kinase [Patescibacteria group bacterium]